MMEQAAEIKRLRERLAVLEDDPSVVSPAAWAQMCDLAASNPTAPEWLREILKDRHADQT